MDLRDENWAPIAAGLIAVALVWVGTAIGSRILRRRQKGLGRMLAGDRAAVETRVRLGVRIVRAVAVIIVVLAVAQAYPATKAISTTIFASSAVIALIVGLAVQRPLGNLGAGILLAFTQPFRIGDRVTVGAENGVVDAINLSYTVLRTDDNRRVYVPNDQIVAQPIGNATIEDPSRALRVRLPVALSADIAQAREVLLQAAETAPHYLEERPAQVVVADILPDRVELEIVVWAADGPSALSLGSEVREQALTRLAGAGLLPSSGSANG